MLFTADIDFQFRTEVTDVLIIVGVKPEEAVVRLLVGIHDFPFFWRAGEQPRVIATELAAGDYFVVHVALAPGGLGVELHIGGHSGRFVHG